MANITGPATTDYGRLGPQAVDTKITAPWFDGSWTVTQGWGPSPYGMEPEGHGFAHWHAGVDVGLDCGTTIRIPDSFGYAVQAIALDNPGGYGTGLVLRVSQHLTNPARQSPQRVVDIYLGHLRQRLAIGAVVAGQHIAISNNTGNSTGCHLHFEVRPPNGRYGTDIDPATWLLYGAATAPDQMTTTEDQNPYNPITQPEQWLEWQLTHDISKPLKAVGNEFLGIAQAGLGSVMMLGGLVMTGAGLRGMSAGQLGRAARSTLTRPATPQRPAQGTPAGVPAEQPVEATTPLSPAAQEAMQEARAGHGRRLSPEVREELRRQRSPAAAMQARRSRVRQSHQARFQGSVASVGNELRRPGKRVNSRA